MASEEYQRDLRAEQLFVLSSQAGIQLAEYLQYPFEMHMKSFATIYMEQFTIGGELIAARRGPVLRARGNLLPTLLEGSFYLSIGSLTRNAGH